MKTTQHSTTAPSVEDARCLVSAALSFFADHHANRFVNEDRADYLGGIDDTSAAVARDVAIARTMASRVPAWTHTTRLREFVDADSTDETITSELADLLLLEEELTTEAATL